MLVLNYSKSGGLGLPTKKNIIERRERNGFHEEIFKTE